LPTSSNEENGTMNTVVIGASSGLGRCIATGLGQRGVQVALLARRLDQLEEAAKEAGADAVAVACDVTDPSSCQDAIAEAAERLGGIDSLVYSTGSGPLRKLVDLDADTWRRTFDTNVIGASLVTAAALPHLAASQGVAAYLTSVSASQTQPWPGLGAYAVSKAALDKLVEAWQSEHPSVGFTRVVVGDCGGGEGPAQSQFTTGWDPDLMNEVMPVWIERNYLAGALLEVDELVQVLDTVLRCGASANIPSVSVVPRRPA
jgi:NAD(P)-dependent dehydrogenase (short-subunit alcohol dehydrogenase family)